MQNFKLILSYDGSRYFGWQRQAKTEHTIQGKLEHILSRILDEPIEVAGSGRTDAGAHALGQCASFRCKSTMAVLKFCPSFVCICRRTSAYYPVKRFRFGFMPD